ncbi:MAG: emp24/gp25L/p24 family protein [Candidatus Bathyarchaeia archaeon]
MRPKSLLLGILLLSIGLFLAIYGERTYTVDVPKREAERLIRGEYIVGQREVIETRALDPGTELSGRFKVSVYMEGGRGDVNFAVYDEDGFRKYTESGAQTYPLLDKPRAEGFNFSLPIKKPGRYYLIFDNSHSPLKKVVELELFNIRMISYKEERKGYELNYVGGAMAAIGLVALAYGALGKTTIPWA